MGGQAAYRSTQMPESVGLREKRADDYYNTLGYTEIKCQHGGLFPRRKAWIRLLPCRKYFRKNLYFAAIRGNRKETLRGRVK